MITILHFIKGNEQMLHHSLFNKYFINLSDLLPFNPAVIAGGLNYNYMQDRFYYNKAYFMCCLMYNHQAEGHWFTPNHCRVATSITQAWNCTVHHFGHTVNVNKLTSGSYCRNIYIV